MCSHGWLGTVVAIAACGRVDFDARRGPCAIPSTAPATVTLSGATYTYTDFNNGRAPTPSSVVTATARDSGAQLAQTTSDANGHYQLAVPTGGSPVDLVLTTENPNYLTSTSWFDGPFERDLDATDQRLANLAQWGDGSLDSVYGASNQTRDGTRGSINVSTRACDGTPIEGAVLTFDPPPGAVYYTGTDGLPIGDATHLPYVIGVAYNAIPGATTITATAPDHAFEPQTITVLAGENVTLLPLRAVD